MNAMHRCAVIGVLDNGTQGLTAQADKILRCADVVIGGTRTLHLFANVLKDNCTTHDLTGNMTQVPQWIRAAQQQGLRCAVLATGDPLCHGIANYLAAQLCFDALEILPNTSTIQLACARVGLPWQDLHIVSIHSKDAGEWQEGATPEHGLYTLRRALMQYDKLAVLTSPENTPDRIARLLLTANLQHEFQMAIAENLCGDDENIITDLDIVSIAQRRFAELNVVLLWRNTIKKSAAIFGIADDQFQQRYPEKGLITKREVRAVSLARMQLRRDSVVWDIGAGSGSVGVEAARLCPQGHVYAVEKNAGDCENALANRNYFSLHNYTLLHAKAPEGLQNWPDPDAVFIGGSGGELATLITLILQRLKPQGCLVMNFVTFENVAAAIAALKASGAEWDITQMQCSRSKPVLDMHRLAAENPVWIVCAKKAEVA
ncbi:MAG: precorrin-6y C5,15-methyltransferase (decarboxylating) subunit CbiE [Pseudomonadales bacterium]|jgi:precorrin-6Y C5,15-methyltransferase (decarboxylating)